MSDDQIRLVLTRRGFPFIDVSITEQEAQEIVDGIRAQMAQDDPLHEQNDQ